MQDRPPDIPTLTWTEVNARRLERNALGQTVRCASMAGIVAAMCGAHAQVMAAAELSIALRMDGVTRSDVRAALWGDRSLVKTFGPRGTVHLLPARDLPMWTGALSTIPARRPLTDAARLSPDQVDAVVTAVGDSLADAELTVDELDAAVIARTGPWAGERVMPAFQTLWPRWRQVIGTAATRGVLCFGPNHGRKVTYTHPRRWLPGFTPSDGDDATQELLRRYLRSYGPTTPALFARWLAAPKGWADSVFAALGSELRSIVLEGTEAIALVDDAEVAVAHPVGVRLLPYFDAFVVGSHPRELLFPGRAAERALAGGQAGNFPVLLIDGVVAGVWHHRRSGRWIDITVEPLEELTRTQRHDLDAQVERVGAILEGAPRLTIGPVSVGPHA